MRKLVPSTPMKCCSQRWRARPPTKVSKGRASRPGRRRANAGRLGPSVTARGQGLQLYLFEYSSRSFLGARQPLQGARRDMHALRVLWRAVGQLACLVDAVRWRSSRELHRSMLLTFELHLYSFRPSRSLVFGSHLSRRQLLARRRCRRSSPRPRAQPL